MSVLSVRQLSIATKQQQLVGPLSFDVQKGEWLAVVGQSGSGKSLTAAAAGRLLPSNLEVEGEVFCNGENLLQLSPAAMRKKRGKQLAFVFQDYESSFNPFLTIGAHFDEYQRTHEKQPKTKRIQQAEEALDSVGLPASLRTRYPSQLSGGQLQRVAIALALLFKPAIIIADEPTTALDSVNAASILQLLAGLQQQTGCAVLFITHDLRHVSLHADRILVMHEGTVVEAGETRQLFEQPVHPYTKKLLQATPSLKRAELAREQEAVMV